MDTSGDLNKEEKMKTVVASGFFDPIHVGHLEYLRLAKEFANSKGARFIVIVDDDKKCLLKKGFEFMPFNERLEIVKAIRYVDEVFSSIDQELNCIESLRFLKPDYFVKGGDRTSDNIPEKAICEELGIEMVFGLGGKVQSSSWLINKLLNR